MTYQFQKELEEGALLFEDEHGQKFVFEKIPFAVQPHEHVLSDFLHDLRNYFKNRSVVSCERVIEYTSFKKYQSELYLIRPAGNQAELYSFETADLAEICQILLNSVQIMKSYHQQGVILNGWSPGVIKRGKDGQIYFLDPLLMNYLQKWLDEAFLIDNAPEVIKGQNWNQASDIFSWGGLAYRLLTGCYPFTAPTLEARLDKIINGKIVAPQDQLPGLHSELGELVMECFNRDPKARPNAEIAAAKLNELIETKRCLLSPEEIQAYSERATENRQRQEFLEQLRGFWRKYQMVTLISLSVIILFLLLIRPGMKKTGISAQNTPEEIVEYYFKSITRLNTELMDATIYKANNTFSEMVGNLYVMNRMQQGISREFKEYIQVKVNDLQVKIVAVDKLKAKYKVNYTLLIITASEKNYIKREDKFTLKPIKNIWKITNIEVLRQRKWLKLSTTPTPAATGTK